MEDRVIILSEDSELITIAHYASLKGSINGVEQPPIRQWWITKFPIEKKAIVYEWLERDFEKVDESNYARLYLRRQ